MDETKDAQGLYHPDNAKYAHLEKEDHWERAYYANGFVEEFWEEQRCDSVILVPGTSLMGKGVMGVTYLVWLGWLFVGIAIVSDIFMESIEAITAQTQIVISKDADGHDVGHEVPIWNETVANLTLMALGSSAPEILLNVLQTAQFISEEPPVLGPSTIVGSAAFNLLIITGVSIIGVGEEPKKIEQTGVFAITSIASLFAYIWLYIVLKGGHSEEEVEIWEAVLTLIFFVLLIAFAYTADRCGRMY